MIESHRQLEPYKRYNDASGTITNQIGGEVFSGRVQKTVFNSIKLFKYVVLGQTSPQKHTILRQ